MKTERFFYSAAGAIMILLTFTGFFGFFSAGKGFGGGDITPAIRGLVITHGLAVTAWYALFFVQSVLVASRNTRIHMKLGWSGVALAIVISVTGYMVAVLSVRHSPDFAIFGMSYPEFMLVMLLEVTAFTVFATIGILARKQATVHRPMMLLAGLSMLTGATARIPFLVTLFGGYSSKVAFLGPIVVFAVLLLVVRLATARKLDRPYAVGLAAMIVAYSGALLLSGTDLWRPIAAAILGN